ncbi:MAG: VCBS repeat-containing protein, partial [Synergistaceae bacterium]|nr:VCBS repeat-containing protein [Synergistaceae bacterium]
VPAGKVYPTDATAGLFVGGEEDESFVVARMTVGGSGTGQLGDKNVNTFECWLEFLDGQKLNGDGTGDPTGLSYNTGYAYGWFPAIRVAAGDFDNDGVASEVAFIRSSGSDHYYFEILKVSRRADGSFSVTSLYARDVGRRDVNGSNIEGCDVVAGDFNGDGKQEAAAVFNDLNGHDGHAAVQVFYWIGGGFGTKSAAVRDDAHRLGGTNASAYTHYWGLIADAGDLDGDGRDEIVYAAPHYGNITNQSHLILSAWGADDSFHLTEESMILTDYEERSSSNFLLRDVSIAVAPVSGFFGGARDIPCADVFLSFADENSGHAQCVVFDGASYNENKNKSGFKDGKGKTWMNLGSGIRARGLVTADFAAESFALGAPTHTIVRDKKSYAAVLQTPPYHVDYVPAPWAADPTRPALTNFSYAGGSVTYSKSDTESTGRDTLFEARQFAERGIDVSAGGTIPIKKLAGSSIGGKASAGWKKSTSSSLSEANKSSASVSMSLSSSTDTSDNLMFYKADFHTWRYPVADPAPDDFFGAPIGADISGTPDGTKYLTYTMSDEPARVQGDPGHSSQFDEYNPIHEEGNLFSYPTTIEATPGYAQKQSDLSLEDQKTLGGGFTEDLVFSKQVTDISSLKTTAKTQFNGSLSLNLGIAKLANGSLSASGTHGHEIGDSGTFTKSYQSSEKFRVSLPSPIMGFNFGYAAYLLKMRAFSDAAGVMNMAFAVDLADNPNAWLWRADDGSVYSRKPDPALVLPGRFQRNRYISNGAELIGWFANTDARSATQIRGIWFYDKDAEEYASASLTRGRNYTISFPVYNASFAGAGDVPIEVGYRDASGASRLIGRLTAALGGWQRDTENNKAMAKFDWTVPADMPEGRYDFYFRVDPDGEIDEVHEDWNTESGDPGYDPGGNNIGRYPFAVISDSASAASSAALFARSAAQDSGFTMTIDDMSVADFRASLADRTEDFRAYGTVTFHGDEPLKNAYVEVTADAGSTAGEKSARRLVANRYIPAIFPGEPENFSFMVSPSNPRYEGLAVVLHTDNGTFSTEIEPEELVQDGGGGCDAGFGAMALAALLCAALLCKKIK